MFVITKHMFIDASLEKVYNAVSQLDSYKDWNPWVVLCDNSNAAVGEQCTARVKLGSRLMKVKHRIVERTPYSKFVWCDVGWFTVFAFGQRKREMHFNKIKKGVDYQVELKVTGLLSCLAQRLYQEAIDDGMALETIALKSYCESDSRL